MILTFLHLFLFLKKYKLSKNRKAETIEKFFNNNPIDAVIHCAALARMKECEENPTKAIQKGYHRNFIISLLNLKIVKNSDI